MARVVINQGILPADMARQEPRKTKALSFVNNKTNMYFVKMGGGVALLHTSSSFPGTAWDGLIFDKDSDQLIDNMIAGLMWLKKHKKELFGEVKKAETGRGGGKSRSVQQTPLGGKAGPSREERAQKAHSKSERKRLEVMREADQSRARVRSGKRNERTK